MDFERKAKYLVVKWEDIEKYLTDDEQLNLHTKLTTIRVHRLQDEKPDHQYVAIVDDSPIYETVWQLLEAEQTGKPNQIEQLQQKKLELLAAIALKDEALTAKINLDAIGHEDFCRYFTEPEFCTCGSDDYHRVRKALTIKPDAEALSQYIEPLVKALEMIAGKRQCIDNLLSNQEIAEQTLAAFKGEQK